MNRSALSAISLAVFAASLAGALAFASPAEAATTTLYASPSGSGTACSQAAPCTLAQVKTSVRTNQAGTPTDVTVVLAGGDYELSSPLSFTAADGGHAGTTVRWTAASGAVPVLTGARPVTGWTLFDSTKNIWVATTPTGQDARDLYVNGVPAPRASVSIARSDITMTASGFTINNSNLNYLSSLPQQNRIELRSDGHFTDRYSPVSSISGTTVTMAQPAWNNNLWGYDTMQNPIFGGHSLALENSRSFISQTGQWYIDPSAGKLYYKPAAGVNPSTLQFRLPRLQTLVSISGTYAAPVQNLAFQGIQFSGTSWLAPSSNGYASQQTGTFLQGSYSYFPTNALTSCSQGCAAFERARTTWNQAPAAVQVSAATNVSFLQNRFVNLGQTALGIGNDANANSSGVGLGASSIDVVGNLFTQLGGGGIVAGGVRADAHHPSATAMTNSDILIQGNTVTKTSFTYRENAGILSTYVDGAQILQNEVFDLPYDAIDIGFGWGVNDPGGSQDYVNRGYYQYNPSYTSATTFRNNVVANNLVHDTKKVFSDGGGIYSLSASPGTVIRNNYLYGLGGSVGLYLDEGSRYITATNNVLRDTGSWVFANTSSTRNTKDNTVDNTWHMGGAVQGDFSASTNNRVTNDHPVSGSTWPTAAQTIICQAGVPTAYRTSVNTAAATCPSGTGAVGSLSGGYSTVSSTPATFALNGSQFAISAMGADIWGAGSQRDDAYGAIYRNDAVDSATTVTARVDSQGDTNQWAKTGVVIRNDLTAPGASAGYAVVVLTPARVVSFQWDSDGDGYLDTLSNVNAPATGAVSVRLVRSDSQVSGYYSTDGSTYTQIGAAVSLPGVATTQDGGIISTSHSTTASAQNLVSNLQFAKGVTSPIRAFASASAQVVQTGSAAFSAGASGADIWGAGGQTDDAYGAVYKENSVAATGQVTALVQQLDTNGWAKSGVAVRNDFSRPGLSAGYAAVVITPANGVSLQWDSNGDGYLDGMTSAAVATTSPVWVRITRSGTTVTGSYSLNGTSFTQIGTATLTGADSALDGGIITTSHATTGAALNQFSSVVFG